MSQTQICPNCRSTFQLNGATDFTAPSLQDVRCPVCDQDIWVASGFWPQRWSVGPVINALQPTSPPVAIAAITQQEAAPVWSGFSIPGLSTLEGGLQTAGIWVLAVLVLVLLIFWVRKK